MSLAHTPTFGKSKYDRFLTSGDMFDLFYFQTVQAGFNSAVGDNYQFGTSANNSRIRPVAKWPELIMRRLNEIAIEHNWIVTESGHPNIGPSGFNWYLYYGTHKVPFYPNSGYPYNLSGYNSNNVQLWRDIENNLQFVWDRCVDISNADLNSTIAFQQQSHPDNDHINDEGDEAEEQYLSSLTSIGYLSDSDIIYNYDSDYLNIPAWRNIWDQASPVEFNAPYYQLFDIDGSGYTLFAEYPPGSGNFSNFLNIINSKFYELPFSGLYSQRRLLQNQGYVRPLNAYKRFVQYRSILGTRDKYTEVHCFNENRHVIQKSANVSYRSTNDSFDNKKNELENNFSNSVWYGSSPNLLGFIGNSQTLSSNPNISASGYNYTPSQGMYTTTIYVPTTNYYDVVMNMTSKFVYYLCPVSNRAAAILTTGESGIVHKLNDRLLNSTANSIQSRYGFRIDDFTKLFYPRQHSTFSTYNNLPYTTDYYSHTYQIPTTTSYGQDLYRTFYSRSVIWTFGIHSIAVTPSILVNAIGFIDSAYYAYFILSDDQYQSFNNHDIEYGDGLEIIYGYLDIIEDIDRYNIALLNDIGKDAIHYYSNENYSLFRDDRPSSFENLDYVTTNNLLSSGDLYHLYQNGKFISDIIVNKIDNNEYTILCDTDINDNSNNTYLREYNTLFRGTGYATPFFDVDYDGFDPYYGPNISGSKDYGYINYPYSQITDTPPPSSTHMWMAMKAKTFRKNNFELTIRDVFLQNPYLYAYELPINNIYTAYALREELIGGHGYYGTPGTIVTVEPQRIDLDCQYPLLYKSYYFDGYESINLGLSDINQYADNNILPTSTGYLSTNQAMLVDMKYVDDNINESMIDYANGILFATTKLGLSPHLGNYGEKIVYLNNNGLASGNFTATMFASGIPLRDYPVTCL